MGSSIKYAITGLKISNLFEINNLLESIGICHDWKELRKQILLRTPVDYISYADEENTIGVCKYCAEEWKIDSVLKQKKSKDRHKEDCHKWRSKRREKFACGFRRYNSITQFNERNYFVLDRRAFL